MGSYTQESYNQGYYYQVLKPGIPTSKGEKTMGRTTMGSYIQES